MLYILGAAPLVAAMVVLNLGRVALDRLADSSYTTRSRVADFFAITFTGFFGTGFVMLVQETLTNLDALHLAGLAASLIATVIGIRYAGRFVRSRAARTPL